MILHAVNAAIMVLASAALLIWQNIMLRRENARLHRERSVDRATRRECVCPRCGRTGLVVPRAGASVPEGGA